jgi:hypothetical protein
MYFSKTLVLFASHLALSCMFFAFQYLISIHFQNVFADQASHLTYTAAAGCGKFDACVGTETCTTVTFTKPTATTVTTCVPTATCLSVYGKLEDPSQTVLFRLIMLIIPT